MALLLLRLCLFKNFIVYSLCREKFKSFFILMLLLILLGSSYVIFYKGLEICESLPLGTIITHNILHLLLLILFIMLLFSNMINSFSTLFSQKELSLLKPLPISLLKIFSFLCCDNLFLSSWASVLLSFPLLLAYGNFFKIDVFSYILIFLGLFLFLVISTSLAGMVIVILANIFSLKKKNILAIVVGIGIIFVLIFGLRFKDILDIETTGVFIFLFEFINRLGFAEYKFWPSYWLGKLISYVTLGDLLSGLFYLCFILVNAGFLVFLLVEVGRKFYERGVYKFVEGGGSLKTFPIYYLLKRLFGRFMGKDIVVLIRTPSWWIQTILFFGLLFMYVFNLDNYSELFSSSSQEHTVIILNLLACGIITSTLSLRFLYPLFSQEITKLWIPKLNVLVKKIVYEKLILGVVLLLPPSFLLMYMTSVSLQMTKNIIYISAGVICLVVVLAFIGVCIGVIYPNPHANYAKIPAGLGGTLSSIVSLLYTFITVFIFSCGFIYKKILLSSSIITLYSIIFCLFLLFLAFTSLKKLELK